MSAICGFCEQEMNGTGCTLEAYDDFPDGIVRKRLPSVLDGPCHDCNTPPGALHHPGCDEERCPLCGGQAIGCSCLDGEDQ